MHKLRFLLRPGAVLCLCLGTILGLGAYTFHYGQGGSYFSNNPVSCTNCHVMREHYDGWQKASHHGFATCNDCHLPTDFVGKYQAKAENGFWHSKGFTLQDFHEPIRIHPKNAKILEQNCLRCHQSLLDELTRHSGEELGISCTHCHRDVGHGPSR